MTSGSPTFHRATAAATVLLAGLLLSAPAHADGIEAGLWRIVSRDQSAAGTSPPVTSSKCLTADEVKDLAATFSPVPRQMINSTCAPVERNLAGTRLTFHLVCKGQLDMDVSGEFNFDTPHHYSATIHNKATMAGMQMIDSEKLLEGEWVSACPQ